MQVAKLLKADTSLALDREAENWGFDTFALVEAAGRSCAGALIKAFPSLFSEPPETLVFAGSGNNGADALVTLRALLLWGKVRPENSRVIINKEPREEEHNPRAAAFRSLRKMGVHVQVWNSGGRGPSFSAGVRLIIDGIAGTGVQGPLRGSAAAMAGALNTLPESAFVVSLDIPSGNSDAWEPGMPLVKAAATVAIEPLKRCLYTPAARSAVGMIIPAGGIFPESLAASFGGDELLEWERARRSIPAIAPEAYKYRRGVVEIHAGSAGSAGAARIAARGAQAAGAGLVRLVVDRELYPILASSAAGVMVAPENRGESRFSPDALLLGPGWGRGACRELILEEALEKEKAGLPLVLDADAITLARDKVFSGRTILSPHPGEFTAFTGLSPEEVSRGPWELLAETARKRNAVILFKSHVLIIVSPDGRFAVVDGMCPALGAGGSGDLLAGICAALAARTAQAGCFDGFVAASAAAALFMEAGKTLARRITDPLEIADKAADLAGEAWLKPAFFEGLHGK